MYQYIYIYIERHFDTLLIVRTAMMDLCQNLSRLSDPAFIWVAGTRQETVQKWRLRTQRPGAKGLLV